MKKIYDIIIIGAGAAGLFSAINIPKKYSKLLLEKNKNPGVKVLLSGGERANVSNMNIEGDVDYFGQNKKCLKSILSRFSQWDIMSWFAENNINIIEEDRGRLILESGDSKELLKILEKRTKENNAEIICKQDVKTILKKEEYEIVTEEGRKFHAKNIIISTGGKSFFQVGTTGEGYNFARSFNVNIIPPHRALCGVSTKKDFSELSGSSMKCTVELLDEKTQIYQEEGPLLFTHFGLSGPIIFNVANALGEYCNKKNLMEETEKIRYILERMSIKIKMKEENSTKKIKKFFTEKLDTIVIDNEEETVEVTTGLQDWRSWKEAKATGGGIDMNELNKYMQYKKQEGMFFIGEVCDITGKTGGYNLQWAWSSAFCCAEYFMKK